MSILRTVRSGLSIPSLARINRDYTEKQAPVRSFIPFRENIDNIITAILKQ